jgi:hypothetical protein
MWGLACIIEQINPKVMARVSWHGNCYIFIGDKEAFMSLGFQSVRPLAASLYSEDLTLQRENNNQFYESLSNQLDDSGNTAISGMSRLERSDLFSTGSFGLNNATTGLGSKSAEPTLSDLDAAMAKVDTGSLEASLASGPIYSSSSSLPDSQSATVALAFNSTTQLEAGGKGELALSHYNGGQQLSAGHNIFEHRTSVGLKGELSKSQAWYELKAYHDHQENNTGVMGIISFKF